jgi:hypothetical protein
LSYLGAIVLVLIFAVVLSRPVRAQAVTTNPNIGTTHSAWCGDKIKVDGFSISPQSPAAGQLVTVTMSIRDLCTSGDARNITWTISADETLLGSGVANSVAPGTAWR